jgi:hypothetical protein
MWPDLVPGRIYWATGLLRPRVGSVIVFRNPANEREMFVKKVTALRDGGCEVAGTVPWGTSSGDIGLVPGASVLGRVLFVTLKK